MRSNQTYTNVMLMLGILASALFLGCQPKLDKVDLSPYDLQLRSDWERMVIPANNPLTKASVELGRSLFFDRRLSVDETVSCASCHKANHGFADGIPKSVGVQGRLGFRNSSPLANVGYLPYFNRDGGIKSLDVFSAVPMEDHDEMAYNLVLMKERLSNDDEYVHQAKQIYDREIDGFVVTRALASYLRTFISDSSPYDRFIYDKDSTALSEQQLRGYQLFTSDKAQCSTCHNGINLTNYAFENNGLYPSYKGQDRGRERVTLAPNDEGKFRVASLRNISLTAPYMHDGSLETLDAVLEHYINHGADHKNEHPAINKINLNQSEKADIIEFLKSLTDQSFIDNPHYQKPS